jgi:hypothetical protein
MFATEKYTFSLKNKFSMQTLGSLKNEIKLKFKVQGKTYYSTEAGFFKFTPGQG